MKKHLQLSIYFCRYLLLIPVPKSSLSTFFVQLLLWFFLHLSADLFCSLEDWEKFLYPRFPDQGSFVKKNVSVPDTRPTGWRERLFYPGLTSEKLLLRIHSSSEVRQREVETVSSFSLPLFFSLCMTSSHLTSSSQVPSSSKSNFLPLTHTLILPVWQFSVAKRKK